MLWCLLVVLGVFSLYTFVVVLKLDRAIEIDTQVTLCHMAFRLDNEE